MAIKNIRFLILVLLLAFIFLAFYSLKYQNKNSGLFSEYPQTASVKPLPEITINNIRIPVEIADTPEKTQKGLSGRVKTSFPEERGMLFIFKTSGYPVFWMIDMKFPLDIIWINDEKVVDISANVPAPDEGTLPQNLPRFSPKFPASYVLEVNAGFAEKNGIKVGDEAEINF